LEEPGGTPFRFAAKETQMGLSEPLMERFDESARRVAILAREEALGFHHNFIGPEHVLLGLLRDRGGLAARTLDAFGLDLKRVRTYVAQVFGRGEPTASEDIALQGRTKKLFELAIVEGMKRGQAKASPPDLLLALAELERGRASGLLTIFKIEPDKLRAQTIAEVKRR
jgi:ATP-dependent Clp protease ATP-binding subunit ClpC